MLPKNQLRRQRMNRLKLYVGTAHPHAAQFPNQPIIESGPVEDEEVHPVMFPGDPFEYDPAQVEDMDVIGGERLPNDTPTP